MSGKISKDSEVPKEVDPPPKKHSPDLVIGMVMGVGTEKQTFIDVFQSEFSSYGYSLEEISVSKIIEQLANEDLLEKKPVNSDDEFKRIHSYMQAGDEAREKYERPDFLALCAINLIKIVKGQSSSSKKVFLITNLKHQDEVKTLRSVYGNSFLLYGIHATTEDRERMLIDLGVKADDVKTLFEKDDAGEKRQSINNTFHLADFFIHHDQNQDNIAKAISRTLRILFSNPYETPKREEFFMFNAYTSSLRSSDLSRQVGAVITSEEGDILSMGANEVPRPGGGLFWADDYDEEFDERDWRRGKDQNTIMKNQTILEIMQKAFSNEIEGKSEKDIIILAKEKLGESLLLEMSEYNRSIHAEMEAILSCSRRNISCQGATLYSTTFPCHNCAKHIIGAGIKAVVYIEPYTKSKAQLLFKSITTKDTCLDNKILFKPFLGVGPRKFFDLFSISLGNARSLKRKESDGKIIRWTKNNGIFRYAIEYSRIEVYEDYYLLKLSTILNDKKEKNNG